MTNLYSEGHQLSLQESRVNGFEQDQSNVDRARPSQVSDTYQRKKVNYLR
jgi:hypothetical protein